MKKSKSELTFFQKVKRHRTLLLMCAPAVLFFFAFNYVPLPGIYVAFVKFNYRKGIFGSKFIGLDNFEFLLSSGKLWDLTKNTILYNLAFILLGNLLAIFVAILLNEMRCKWFKKVSQTIMFLPYFISQVLIGLLVFNLLNFDTGFVNTILANMGLDKWQPYSDPTVWPISIGCLFCSNHGYRRRDDGGSESGRRERFPKDTLYHPSFPEADDGHPAAVCTGRYRKRKLRIVL